MIFKDLGSHSISDQTLSPLIDHLHDSVVLSAGQIIQTPSFRAPRGHQFFLADPGLLIAVGGNRRHGPSYRHQFVPVLHEVMYRHQTLSHAHVTS